MMNRGLFVVLEGSQEGSARIQLNLLKERLKAIGYEVALFELPLLNSGSSHFLKKYQEGDYGHKNEVSPYTAALFYALDRYEAAKDIEKALDEGKIVLCDNYVGSSMAVQGSRFGNAGEQRGFFVWDDNLEFQLLGLPRPDINIYIRPPRKKSDGAVTAAYDLLCELFPKDFTAVDDTGSRDKIGVAKLNDKIWQQLKPKLPKYRPNPSHSVVVTLTGDKEKQLPAAKAIDNDTLILPVKSGSLYLKTLIDRYVPGSAKPAGYSWSENMYQVYRPEGIYKELQQQYKDSLKRIAMIHETIKEKAAARPATGMSMSDILLSVTPFFALASFELSLDKKQAKEVSSHLLAQEAGEPQWLAKQIFLAARQKWPEDFKQPLESDNDESPISDILSLLPSERLSPDDPGEQSVKILDVTPRQEFDLLAESIYPLSNLSLREITDAVADWPYSQKYQSLLRAVRQQAILQKARYKMDIISDQLVLTRLAKAMGLSRLQVQSFTPRYGYDVPQALEDAGLDDLYTAAFDESLKLFSLLQSANRDDIAPYAALAGHKVRWQLNADAARLKTAFDTRDGSGYSDLIIQITEAVSEIHPLLWHILSGTINGEAVKPAGGNNSRIKPYHQRHQRRRKPKK
jgi:thymidylate kinase